MSDCIWIHYARPRPHWYGLDEAERRDRTATWTAVAEQSTRDGGVFQGRYHVRGQHDFETVETWRFLGFVDRPTMRRRASEQIAKLDVRLRSGRVPVSTLSGGQRQSVAIARAALWADQVIFMDEPTAALGVLQTRRVIDLIRQVRDQGIAVVLISHNMPQVLEVADRVEVLRLGRRAASIPVAEASIDRLVSAMTSGLVQKGAPA